MHAPNNLIFISHGDASRAVFSRAVDGCRQYWETVIKILFPLTNSRTSRGKTFDSENFKRLFSVLIFCWVDDKTQIKNHSSAIEFIESVFLFIRWFLFIYNYFDFAVERNFTVNTSRWLANRANTNLLVIYWFWIRRNWVFQTARKTHSDKIKSMRIPYDSQDLVSISWSTTLDEETPSRRMWESMEI